MTTKLYYMDPLAKKINARVLDRREKGDALWLLLDQTIFYPGGGGQLADKGKISGKPLLDVREKDGQIWHKVEMDDKEDFHDSVVLLELDWSYRYYQMQQHTGQHLLSAIFHQKGYQTLSVHLGENHTLVELEGPLPEKALFRQIESEIQRYIARAIPVKIYYVSKEEAARMPLRRPVKGHETLRIVEISGIDVSACGGIHVGNTAEIGAIKILGSEHIRGHVRVEAVIGTRAFEYFDELHQVNLLLREKLNTDHLQFNSRIGQMQEEIGYLKKLAKFYDAYFVKYLSAQLVEDENDILIVHKLEHGEQKDAAEIAKHLSKEYGKVALIQFDRRFFLASPDAALFDTIKFLKEKADVLELKAGGPQGFCQGIMNKNNFEQIAETIQQYIRQK